MSEKCDLCIRKSEAATTAAKRHLNFLLGMLAMLILRRSRLLWFNSLQQSKQIPSQQMHKTLAHDQNKNLQLANWTIHTFGNWQGWNCRPIPSNTSRVCKWHFEWQETVLSLMQLLFVLWQLLLHALLFSPQPQMPAAFCLPTLLVSFWRRGIEGFIHLTASIHSMKGLKTSHYIVLLKHQHDSHVWSTFCSRLLSTTVETTCAANKNTCLLLLSIVGIV